MENNENKVIKISFNKFLSIAAVIVMVLFVGINVFAYKMNKPNLISAIEALIKKDDEIEETDEVAKKLFEEAVLAIRDGFNIEYDSEYESAGRYTLYGALIDKKCVCEGYAKAFKYLANAAGINCEILQGEATNSYGTTESHAWNCVEVANAWYQLDATWDDPVIVGKGVVFNKTKYKYFLKGTATFDRDHKISRQFTDEGKIFNYPELSRSDYD